MVESEDTIVLEGVPIITPNRDVVASGLTFKVESSSLSLPHSSSHGGVREERGSERGRNKGGREAQRSEGGMREGEREEQGRGRR